MLVDLPQYPFDHTESYWSESRLSRNFRFRQFPRHDLLGAPISDWDATEAQWRHFLRHSENPWITDHKITGSTVYPGAGILVMAIEAATQVAGTAKKIKGYRIKEACFHTALTVPSGENGIETHFYPRPFRDSSFGSSAVWSEFQLYSFENGEWKENCCGVIGVEHEVSETPVDSGHEVRGEFHELQQTQQAGERECTVEVNAKQLYEHFNTVGLNFGPTFRLLGEGRCSDGGKSVGDIHFPDLASKMPKRYDHEHVIHPSALDAIL
ncbi:hypothetical protein MMC18_006392 [Xylographa bjoerkii]|nr:hypothetical protein [Xylographa bjoerkii]